MVQLLQWLTLMYQNRNILPAQKDIFRALQLTSYEKVKVVIVGQDPYPGLDKKGVYHAHGLSFSSQSRHQVPASLKNIFRELEMDLGYKPPLSADLTGWAKQGVLLLNTVLTRCV